MAEYNYEQTREEHDSYVKFNITPALSGALRIGDSLTISGVYKAGITTGGYTKCEFSGLRIYRDAACTQRYTGSKPFAYSSDPAPLRQEQAFSVRMQIPVAALEYQTPGSTFTLYARAEITCTGTSNFAMEMSDSVPIAIQITDDYVRPTFSAVGIGDGRVPSALARFGSLVQGQSLPVFALAKANFAADARDVYKYDCVFELRSGETMIHSGGFVFSGAESAPESVQIELSAPLEAAGEYTWRLTACQQYAKAAVAQAITGETTGTFTVLAYAPPKLTDFAVKRYKTVMDDQGETHYEDADDGDHVHVSVSGSVQAVAGENAWDLDIIYAPVGTGENSIVQALSGNDGQSISFFADRNLIQETIPETKDYEFEAVLTDWFGNSASLIANVYKATALANLEKFGFAIGMRCGGNNNDKRFEVAKGYKSHFYDGIVGVTDLSKTEEVKTGGTWIDGRPIYHALIVAAVPRIATPTKIVDLDGIAELIEITGAVERSDGSYPLSHFASTTDYHNVRVQPSGDAPGVYARATLAGTLRLIIRYTKLIDPPKAYAIPAMTANEDKGCVVSASSSYNATYAAWRAFDGDASQNSFWACAAADTNRWIQIEMPYALKNMQVHLITNVAGNMTANNVPTAGKFMGSNDGSDWVEIGSYSGRATAAGVTDSEYALENAEGYKYLRVTITASGNSSVWAGFVDIRASGDVQ